MHKAGSGVLPHRSPHKFHIVDYKNGIYTDSDIDFNKYSNS